MNRIPLSSNLSILSILSLILPIFVFILFYKLGIWQNLLVFVVICIGGTLSFLQSWYLFKFKYLAFNRNTLYIGEKEPSEEIPLNQIQLLEKLSFSTNNGFEGMILGSRKAWKLKYRNYNGLERTIRFMPIDNEGILDDFINAVSDKNPDVTIDYRFKFFNF